MDQLKSLIRIISNQKTDQIDLFSSKNQLPYKTRLLYDAIIQGIVNTEEEAILHIYDSLEHKPKYKKLESRLKQRLLNSIFFLKNKKSESTDLQLAKYNIAREYNLINILINKRESTLAMTIAKKLLKKTIKYEVTDYSVLLSRILFNYHSVNSPSPSKMKHFKDILLSNQKTLNAEIIANTYFNEVSYLYITKKAKFSKSELLMMSSYVEELLPKLETIKSFRFNMDTYNIITSFYILSEDYDKSIEYCTKALDFFDAKPYDNNFSKYNFRNSLILSALGKRKYALAEEYSNDNFKILTKGLFNWYLQCNYHFIILSAQEKYQELYKLVLDVTAAKSYKKFVLQHEYWNVIEAYIHFLIRMDKITPNIEGSSKRLRPFSLARFLNDVPKFSKDKRGLNISILIIQFLFLLLDRKYSKLIDRLDAIKQYSYRYLKNDESYRSNLFIKMLLKVADADFHPIAAKRYTKEMHEKLLASNPSANFQSVEIEVIPYEKLWEIVMELLEKNRTGKTT